MKSRKLISRVSIALGVSALGYVTVVGIQVGLILFAATRLTQIVSGS